MRNTIFDTAAIVKKVEIDLLVKVNQTVVIIEKTVQNAFPDFS